MFQKVLIVEDHQGTNYSLQRTLEELGIKSDIKNYVYYCDDALSRIQKAKKDEEPYEIMITDLSFDEDFQKQKINDGIELIRLAKDVQPDLKIMVFSSQNRLSIAKALFDDLNIDAFIPKGRGDVKDLVNGIQAVFDNKKYISTNLKKEFHKKVYHFEDIDKAILNLLADGKLQKEMPTHLEKMGVKPFGLSSIEKRLKTMRETLEFYNNEQLIAYCKDKKII